MVHLANVQVTLQEFRTLFTVPIHTSIQPLYSRNAEMEVKLDLVSNLLRTGERKELTGVLISSALQYKVIYVEVVNNFPFLI